MRIIRRIVKIASFIGFYILELILANFRVLYDILTPRHHMKPGFVAVQLDAKTDLEILSVANLVAMTPGTLSVEVSEDKRLLFIHVMYLDDADEFRQMIKSRFEARVLEVLR